MLLYKRVRHFKKWSGFLTHPVYTLGFLATGKFSVVTARYTRCPKICLQKYLKNSGVKFSQVACPFSEIQPVFWSISLLSCGSILLSLPQLPRAVVHSFVNGDMCNTIYMLMRRLSSFHQLHCRSARSIDTSQTTNWSATLFPVWEVLFQFRQRRL